MQEAQHTAARVYSPPQFVTGRYRVLVERLEATGEAVARVIVPVEPASASDLAKVYHLHNTPAPEPHEFTFVGGLPGEVLDIEARWTLPRPDRRPSRHVPPPFVRVVRVVESSPERVEAPCVLFGECGGCQFQHMDYAAQLRWKQDRVLGALAAHGLGHITVEQTRGCENPWHYRNHMRFSVNREGRAGLTARGSHRVLEVSSCHIAHPAINRALDAVRDAPLTRPQLAVRVGDASGDILLLPAQDEKVGERLTAAGLCVRGTEMEERLLGVPFRIRPSSFFQTNTAQANQMARLVLERLPTGPEATLVDAYCGVGTFAALMARQAGKVIAIEESASSIRDAAWNLREFENVEILQAKVEDALPGLHTRVDGLVIDPPRAGCHRAVLAALTAHRVPRVVYVSCNPDTLARDLATLCAQAGAYRVVCVQPLDMFPQTAHVETIATLEACP